MGRVADWWSGRDVEGKKGWDAEQTRDARRFTVGLAAFLVAVTVGPAIYAIVR